MFRVLHIIDWFSAGGGAELHLLQTARYLSARGIEQQVLQLYEYPDRWEPEFVRCGIRIVRLERRHRLPLLPFALRPVLECVRSWKPDIISTHLTSSDILGRVAARRIGTPVVSTWHNTTYDPANAALYRPRARLGLAIYRTLDRFTAGYGTRFVAVSKAVQASSCAALGVPPSKCQIIPVTLDMSRFPAEAPAGRRAGPGLRLIHVGRHHPQKGLGTLIEALSLVPKELDISLDLFGRGPLTKSLEEEVLRLGVSPRVRFRGMVQDIAPFLLEADVFVFPSIHEGFGLAYIEALAAGLPVIASELVVLREIDPQGLATCFVRPGDPASLAREIVGLATDPERRHKLAGHARALAEPFDVQRAGEKYYDLFSSLIRAPRNGTLPR